MRDLEADNDPLTSIDGMLLDIITNCKTIDNLEVGKLKVILLNLQFDDVSPFSNI